MRREAQWPPADLGPRQPSAGAAPRLPLGRSDPSSRRSARARRTEQAAELLWWPGRPCAAWCCWSGAGWRWLASQEGEKTPPLAPTGPPGQGRPSGTETCTQQFPPGARLGLDPAALPARQVAGAWANHRGSALPCGAPLLTLNSSKPTGGRKPGLGPRPGLSLWLLSLWLLGLRPGRAAWLLARSAAPATHAGPAAADRAHQRGPDTCGWRAGPPLPGG